MLSPCTHIAFSLNRAYDFYLDGSPHYKLKHGSHVTAICMGFADKAKHSFGIDSICSAFGATFPKRIITNIPKQLQVVHNDDYSLVYYSSKTAFDLNVLKNNIHNSLVVSYWDEQSFYIASSNEYSSIIDDIYTMLTTKKVAFAFNRTSFDIPGSNLLISCI